MIAGTLLQTKLHRPPLQTYVVERSHLIEQLNQGLYWGCKLTLVLAPAGYGKSTLGALWAEEAVRPFAWLSLAKEENEPTQFASYFLAALQTVVPTLGKTAVSLLEAPQPPPLGHIFTQLLNDLTQLAKPIGLILDDYHLITNPTIHSALDFFIAHLPPDFHLVLLSRNAPPLALPQLRAYQQMNELSLRDCRFTETEMRAFLQQLLPVELEDEAFQALVQRTEGWAAGLQMAALSLRRSRNVSDTIRNLDSQQRYIFDYLSAEVLNQQPPDVRNFLQKTAVLPRFSAPLCNHLTQRQDSHHILQQLEADNYFLIPLDEKRQWYRYHHLFAGFLQSQLSQSERQQLQQQASHWFAEANLLVEAIELGLTAHAFTPVAQLIQANAESLFSRGRWQRLVNWLNVLPQTTLTEHPFLIVLQGVLLLQTGDTAKALICATQAAAHESRFSDGLQRSLYLTLQAIIHKFHNDYDAALATAQAAVALLAGNDGFFKLFAQHYVGAVTQDRHQRAEQWKEAFLLAQQQGRHLLAGASCWEYASTLIGLGQLQEALQICEATALELAQHAAPATGPPNIALGSCYYEMNALEEAAVALSQGLPACEQFGQRFYILSGQVLEARLAYANGQMETAVQRLRQTTEQARQWGNETAVQLFALESLEYQLRWGQYAAVSHWANTQPDPSPSSPREALLLARLRLAQNRADDIVGWLATLADHLAAKQGISYLITTHILQALAEQARGNGLSAQQFMTKAIGLAASEGYVRRFVDEGTAVLPLLQQCRHIAPRFVDQVIAALQHQPATPNAEPLPELAAPPKHEVVVATEAKPMLRLQLFNGIYLWLDETAVTQLYSTRVRALLAYLATHPNQPHSRDKLMTLLWSDFPTSKARNNLRNTLSVLKRILSPILKEELSKRPLLQATRHDVQFNLEPQQHEVDVLRFAAAIASHTAHQHQPSELCESCQQQLSQAVALYTGDFLADLFINDSPPFDEWQRALQEQHHRQALSALDTLTAHFAAAQQWEPVKNYAQQQLKLEAWHEQAHWHLIQALHATHATSAARAHYQHYCRLLDDELGLPPSPQFQQLVQQIEILA